MFKTYIGVNNAPLIALPALLAAYKTYQYMNETKLSTTESTTEPSSTSTTSSDKDYLLLVGDIGGTNCRLALYLPSTSKPLYAKEYLNSKYITNASKTFEKEIFLPFLQSCVKEAIVQLNDNTCIIACFAAAGPVHGNAVVMTNIDIPSSDNNDTKAEIILDGNAMETNMEGYLQYIHRCKIVNDFVGQGYGALDLDLETETIPLTSNSLALAKDSTLNRGPKVCVGAGTGLGECYLTQSSLDNDDNNDSPKAGYECYPSEGGHVEYAPRTDIEMELLSYLKEKFQSKHRVSVERVVSGRGLANVYEFLAKRFPDQVDPLIHNEFLNAGDMQGRVVGVNSHPHGCKVCIQAAEIFASAYGSEVGSAALKFIPTGGVYVTGGLTPKNIQHIKGENSPFMKAYFDKGRVSGLLNTIPIFAVMAEDLGLRGARVCAQRELSNILRNMKKK
eukprot:CAMPEP_0184860254 /NCGR_PEP_ID=MMETSP0580-20130426/5180_1 /TAXON_ID=1118495 /ORGANISM="Dactyliosolen fragilissimus" /LENGTH=446 /DNA_ID=CAMNT_0027357293 /DNA_START=30 /DNA_END=1370 /DNA_ORIENTATION=-